MFKKVKKTGLERILGWIFSLAILAVIFFAGLKAMNDPNGILSQINNINENNIENENYINTITENEILNNIIENSLDI